MSDLNKDADLKYYYVSYAHKGGFGGMTFAINGDIFSLKELREKIIATGLENIVIISWTELTKEQHALGI